MRSAKVPYGGGAEEVKTNWPSGVRATALRPGMIGKAPLLP